MVLSDHESVDTGGTIWTPLPEPRALTAAEGALLFALVPHARSDELTEQAATARVTGLCWCGCPSVRLSTAGPAIPPDAMALLSASDRLDTVTIESEALNASGDTVNVWVHVVGGLLTELEVFAGEGIAVDLPAPGDLRNVAVR